MSDEATAGEILAASSPRRAKELGGKVRSYDTTRCSVLAEASSFDYVWDVGIGADDVGFSDMTEWKGENL